MRYFSMFSGIGGFELAMPESFECIGFSEIDKYAIKVYQKHFSEHINYGNATNINPEQLPGFDLLCGGFPCQSFSVAGKRGGFEDIRGTLFFEIARIVKHKKPGYLLLENVKGLLSHDEGKTFDTILRTLDELGYDCQWQVLNSRYWTGQNRNRIYILAHLRGTSRPQVFPIAQTVERHITKSKNSPKKYMACLTTRNGTTRQSVDMGFIYTKDGIRDLTPIERERLQGFPDGWTEGISEVQRVKCLGNAVTVNVVKSIVTKLNNHEPKH